MHEVLVNRLGGLSLPRKSVVRLTDRPDMTLDVYRGRKTTNQHTHTHTHTHKPLNPRVISDRQPGPSCSKIMKSLANVSLKFQKLISEKKSQFFVEKSCAKASIIFSTKKSVYLVIEW